MIDPWLSALATAAQFLTRLPISGGASADPSRFDADMPRALILLPLVGGLIGGTTALALWLASQFWPVPLAVLLALAMEARLTGALHEDAVADFCDAFGGGHTSDDVLRILKDSRIGSYGMIGLAFALALRAGALMMAGGTSRTALALVASGAAGRLLILFAMAWIPPVQGRSGLGTRFGSAGGGRVAAAGTAVAAPILGYAAVMAPWATGVSVLSGAVFLIWFRALLLRRIGGATGDCLGFAGYAGILLVTLPFAART